MIHSIVEIYNAIFTHPGATAQFWRAMFVLLYLGCWLAPLLTRQPKDTRHGRRP